MLKAAYIATAAVIVALTMIECARAGHWQWFQLCQHKTGKMVGSLNQHGIKTTGGAWVDVRMIKWMIPVAGKECTIVEFADKSTATVIGTPRSIWCKAQGGPGCEPNDE